MSRFSIPTVLRGVPRELLKQFLLRYGHESLSEYCDAPNRADVDALVVEMELLPKDVFDRLEANLHEVCDLACETGLNAIIEAAFEEGHFDFAAEVPDGGWYHKAMWVLLNHERVFTRALFIHEIDGFSYWRKRTHLHSVSFDQSEAARYELSNAISEIFMQQQGRGQRCTLHVTSRKGVEYFLVYVDDFLMSVEVHDDGGRLTTGCIRPTFQVVFAFNPSERSLELYAPKVPVRVKADLERAFARVMLRTELPPWTRKAAYELDHLKDRGYALATDPEDAIRVRLCRIRLSSLTNDRRIILDGSADGKAEDVYEMMDNYIDAKEFPKAQFHITQATLRFEFLPLPGRKAGVLSFDVTWPSTCGLRSQRPERVAIIQKYLKRWKIDRSESIEPAAVES